MDAFTFQTTILDCLRTESAAAGNENESDFFSHIRIYSEKINDFLEDYYRTELNVFNKIRILKRLIAVIEISFGKKKLS